MVMHSNQRKDSAFWISSLAVDDGLNAAPPPLHRGGGYVCVGGNDTYGITRIPTMVVGRGVVRRADQTDSTRFVYPGSGREDA